MLLSKILKRIISIIVLVISLFTHNIDESAAYPVFAQQGYSNPRAANGKLACANCHLNQKSIEIETPQAVLPNSIFKVALKVPYDSQKQQIGANGKKADLNVGGILIMPKGFKLASKKQVPNDIKKLNKGVFISPYSTEQDNILVVGPIAGKTHQELVFPIIAPDPETNTNVKYLTYPVYAGGNRGRGQVYPTGEKSNINTFGASQAGQIADIIKTDKDESTIIIVNSKGIKTEQTIPNGLILTVKKGSIVEVDQPLNLDPNVGGFGQEETELVLQNPLRIIGYITLCFFLLLTQIFLILKKKQFEKVQAAELNF